MKWILCGGPETPRRWWPQMEKTQTRKHKCTFKISICSSQCNYSIKREQFYRLVSFAKNTDVHMSGKRRNSTIDQKIGRQLLVQWTTLYLLSYQDCHHSPAGARLLHQDRSDKHECGKPMQTNLEIFRLRRDGHSKEVQEPQNGDYGQRTSANKWGGTSVEIFDDMLAVLSFGKLCEEHGYPHEWANTWPNKRRKFSPSRKMSYLLLCKDNTSKDPFSRCEICKNLAFRWSWRWQDIHPEGKIFALGVAYAWWKAVDEWTHLAGRWDVWHQWQRENQDPEKQHEAQHETQQWPKHVSMRVVLQSS